MSETASTAALDDTMGALLICTVVSACFQGITVLCSWEYFVDHTKDRAIKKVIVTAVCFIDTLHQIFITHALYIYLVKGFSDPAIMMRLLWSFLSQILLAALQGLLCQGFFTWRVWVVSQKNKVLCAIIAALVVGNFVVALYYFGRSVHFKSLAELWQLKDIAELLVIGYSANIVRVQQDPRRHPNTSIVYHRVSPFHALQKDDPERTVGRILIRELGDVADIHSQRTDRLVDKFTLWVLTSGLLTSLVGIFCFITEVVWPHSLLSAAMYTILCRVYAVSVLTVLNSRMQLGPSGSNPPRLSNEIISTGSRAARFQFTKPGELAIHVECDTQMQYDNDIESPQSRKDAEEFELKSFPMAK
ncbi:hypothetical protein EDD18DRAFT_1461917 [Armillaria luteobubalina]|uniref:DUF6534 domain-containing protein n=1 Tax=Armillaria luteobubalina TaxID=153913 RepID=A0AA39Q910_9AGAR|nr:hypothetical protein EDD18DRAFT_1461917 [Armillaria luteobubalina]